MRLTVSEPKLILDHINRMTKRSIGTIGHSHRHLRCRDSVRCKIEGGPRMISGKTMAGRRVVTIEGKEKSAGATHNTRKSMTSIDIAGPAPSHRTPRSPAGLARLVSCATTMGSGKASSCQGMTEMNHLKKKGFVLQLQSRPHRR